MNWRVTIAVGGLCAVLAVASSGVSAAPTDEEDLARVYGGEEMIALATGTRQSLSRAPSIATVITAADIRSMGAVDLDQVLAAVPGLHVSYSPLGYNSIYVMRGIVSDTNPQVLVLINGIPVTNLFAGDRGQGWGGMAINGIARIEVIRGPGSALYGADAFAGTINIVTKTAEDIRGTEAGARAGSFNTREAWLQHGGRWGGFDAAVSLEWRATDGQKRTIDADAQSFYDTQFGTRASLAPGPVNTRRDAVEARLDLARNDWRLRLGYQGRRDIGTGGGYGQALDPVGRGASDRINADVTYDKQGFSDNWDVTAQLSYFDVSTRYDLTLFPPGAFNYGGINRFPDGMAGNPDVYERHARLSAAGVYTGIARHRIRLGTGFNNGELYKVGESKNYDAGFNPIGPVIDVSNDPSLVFIRPHNRQVVYALAQDEWSFTPDWSLTAGLRYDHYSDFGSTTNPRLALVWQTRYNLTTKLLYGRAFRAPAFAELYNINNPVALGNSSLKPETIDTVELAFDYQPTSDVTTRFNMFRYEMKDIIRFVGNPPPSGSKTAQNSGGQDGHGLEWELRWAAGRSVDVKANYAWQRSTDNLTDRVVPGAPGQQIYAQADWRFLPDWHINTQVKRIMDRARAAGDSRASVPDYTLVNMTLRRKQVIRNWDVALLAYNLLNADAREPSSAPGFIRYDLPLPGRTVYLEVRYSM
ncbi:MAG: TonB-dependent receptor [Gammaproteobacteria bacterium]